MMRCVVKWTCNHCERDFYIDQETVEMDAVLALTDSPCPECGHLGASVALNVPDDAEVPRIRSRSTSSTTGLR